MTFNNFVLTFNGCLLGFALFCVGAIFHEITRIDDLEARVNSLEQSQLMYIRLTED